jgi:N-acetyl-gamma-glutamyl-phosphate reductase
MHKYAIGVIGASGYSGIELCRILAAHPGAEVRFVASDRWEGTTVRARTGIGGAVGSLAYVPNAQALKASQDCAAVLLATPAEASLELVPALLERGIKVVDLSGAFRLGDSAAYPRYYGFEHRLPALLEAAVYGLPELVDRKAIAAARLVANPGCYPTAAALALVPLLRAGLLADESIVIDAASGVSGAGRQASDAYSFCEVADDVRPYKVLRHQHTPEIAQSLARGAGKAVRLTFTPHLLPIKRGILSTASARLAAGTGPSAPAEALRAAYGDEPLVEVLDTPEQVSIARVVGTARAAVAVSAAESGFDPGRVVVVSSIDNLLKGAASQAVQNLNLMLGLPERTALEPAAGVSP